MRERRWGRSEVSKGSGDDVDDVEATRSAGGQAAGAMASSRAPASPPCLPGGDEAAGWRGPA